MGYPACILLASFDQLASRLPTHPPEEPSLTRREEGGESEVEQLHGRVDAVPRERNVLRLDITEN